MQYHDLILRIVRRFVKSLDFKELRNLMEYLNYEYVSINPYKQRIEIDPMNVI